MEDMFLFVVAGAPALPYDGSHSGIKSHCIRALLASEKYLHPRLFALLMRASRPAWSDADGLVATHYGSLEARFDLLEGAEREAYMHRYDPPLTRFIASWCRRGDIYVDVGANAGQFAAFVSAIVGPAGQVIAFEPNPQLAARLQRFASNNNLGNFTVRAVALGNRADRALLHISRSHPYAALDVACLPDYPVDRVVEVEVSTLDRELATDRNRPRIHLLKIDAQGYELRILEGAKNWLRCNPPDAVVVEAMAEQTAPMFELMRGFGYRPLVLAKLAHGVKFLPYTGEVAAGSNILWLHERSPRSTQYTDRLVPLS